MTTNLLQPARCERGIFLNPVPTDVGGFANLRKVLWRLLLGREERVPRKPMGPFRTDAKAYRQPSSSGLRVTWFGHSSLLLEIDGTTVLIDPVFSERASFVQWAGPKRFFPPTISATDLPPYDAVLLTHDHYDHLDAGTIHQLKERTPLFVCSLGVGKYLREWGVDTARIHEMNWMDTFTVPSGSPDPLTLTALPARHFSGRGLKRYSTLWSSFALRTGRHNVYHGADSGYYEGFRQIGEAYGPFDLALLEVGAFDPLWADIHLGPDNAVQAALDLRANAMMPIHWGLFNLALHDWFQPPERTVKVAGKAGLPLWMPEPGRPEEFTGEPLSTLWWRRYCTAGHAARERTGEAASKAAIRI